MPVTDTIPGIPIAFVNHVELAWVGDHRFEGGRPGSPSITVDASAKTGPSPVDTFLAGLASCTSVDVLEILAKRRTPVAAMRIQVEGARANAVPKRVVGVLLTYLIDGEGIEAEHAARAIDLAVSKYCSVRDSLDPKMPVRWKLILNGDEVDPTVRAPTS
jgi:putative redox protein